VSVVNHLWLISGLPLQIELAFISTAVILVIYRRYPGICGRLAGRFKDIRPASAILAAALLPVTLRIAALPLAPPPQPHVADEFSHLLQADTLIAGRFANPAHPLARHFETFYVLQHPTYASIYPLGEGLVLAAGRLLAGNAWAGVLLAVALMSGAITWMLFGCLEPRWAAIGGLLAAFTYGLAEEWIDSYWGGAFCAFGGALLFGAMCRMRKSPTMSLALIAGIGWSIVWLTRPFESLLLLVALWGFIFVSAFSGRWKSWFAPACALVFVQLAVGGVSMMQNRAVTGSFFSLPYQLSQRTYGVPQTLWGQAPIREPNLDVPKLRNLYTYLRARKDFMDGHHLLYYGRIFSITWVFFVRFWLSMPIALGLFAGTRATRYLGALIACALIMAGFYGFFLAHYIAAYACVFMLLSVRGLQTISHWRSGPVLVCFLALGSCATNLGSLTRYSGWTPATQRSQLAAKVLGVPGRHVVFVRYLHGHDIRDEWVYNLANVDASRLVWSTAMGPAEDSEVARYYPGRRLWIADVDGHKATLSPYDPSQP
jgi:hypothetical protein